MQEEEIFITEIPTSSIVLSPNSTQIIKVPHGPIDLSSGHIVSVIPPSLSPVASKEEKLAFGVRAACGDKQIFVLSSFQFDSMASSTELSSQGTDSEASTPSVLDVSGSLSAEPTDGATTMDGAAAYLDGIDDCILLPAYTVPESNEYTIELWLIPDRSNSSVQVLFYSDIFDVQNDNTTGVVVELKTLERTGLLAGIPVEASEKRIESAKKLKDLEWSSIAIQVVKGLDPTVDIYIDGVLVSQWVGFNFQLSGDLGNTSFGCQRSIASNLSYTGILDEIRVWSRKVPAQFLSLADGEVVEQEDLQSGLWAKYSFDNTTLLADAGIVVDDGSLTHSHHATIAGNVSVVKSNLGTINFPRLSVSRGATANYTLEFNFTGVSLMESSVFISTLPIQGQLRTSPFDEFLIGSTPYRINQSVYGNYSVTFEAREIANGVSLLSFDYGILFNGSETLGLNIPVYIKILDVDVEEVDDTEETIAIPDSGTAPEVCTDVAIAINASNADQTFSIDIPANLSMTEKLVITTIPTLVTVKEASNENSINGTPYIIFPQGSIVSIVLSDFLGEGSDVLRFTTLDSSDNIIDTGCITLTLSTEEPELPSLITPATYSVGYNEMKFFRIIALRPGISSDPVTVSISSVPTNGVLYASGSGAQINLVDSVPKNATSDGALSLRYDPPVNAGASESFGDLLDTFDIDIFSESSSQTFTISFILDDSVMTGAIDTTISPAVAGPAGFEARFDSGSAGFVVELSLAQSSAIDTLTSFTIESWFRMPLGSFIPFACLITQGVFFPPPPLTSNSAPFAIQWHDTLGLGFHITTSGLDRVSIYSGQDYDDGIWHLVSGTFNFETGAMRLYVDGMLASEASLESGVPILGSTSSVVIGSNAAESIPGFPGSIDHVRLFLEPLSASQISSRYIDYEAIETRNSVSFVDTLSFAPLNIGFEVDFNQATGSNGVSLFPSTAPLRQVAVAEFDDASQSFIGTITLQVTSLDSILVISTLPDRGNLLIFSENGTLTPVLSPNFEFSTSVYGNRLLYRLKSEDVDGAKNATYAAGLPNDTTISYFATAATNENETPPDPTQDLPSKTITVNIVHFKEFEEPICEGIELTGLEGENIQIELAFADPQELPVTINVVDLGSTNGIVQGGGETTDMEAATLTYVPDSHFHSPPNVLFAYEVVNEVGLSSGLCPIKIILDAVNSEPKAILPVFYAMYGNVTTVSVGLLLSVEDADVGENPMGFLTVTVSVEKGLLTSNSFSSSGVKTLVIEGPLGYVNAELKTVLYVGVEAVEDDLSLEVNDNGFTGLGGELSDKGSTHIFHCTSYVARASSTLLIISFDCPVGQGLINSNISCSAVLPESIVQLLGTSPSCSFISLTVFVAELDSDQQLLPPPPIVEIPQLIDLNIEGLFPSLFVDPSIGIVVPGLDPTTQELIERSIAVLNVASQFGRCSDVDLDGSYSEGGFNDEVLDYFFRLFDVNVTGTEEEIASLRQAQGFVERTRDQPIITIQAGVLPPGDYVVQLQINNAFGFPSDVVTTSFTQLDMEVPSVKIQLPNNNQSYPQGAQIVIPATVTSTPLMDCSPSNVSITTLTFQWTAAYTPPGSSVQQEFDLSSAGIDANSKDLFIPGGTLPVGSWRVTLTVTEIVQQEAISNFDVYLFQITPVSVVAFVEGGFVRTWPAGETLTLDASRSVNPAGPDQDLEFSWGCAVQGSDAPCPFSQVLAGTSSSTVSLETDLTQANLTVIVIVTASNNQGSTDLFSIQVTFVEAPTNSVAGEIALASFIVPSHLTYASAGITLEAEVSLGSEPLEYSWVIRGEAVSSCKVALQPHCFTAGNTAELNFTSVENFPNGLESTRFTIGADALGFGRYVIELYLNGSFNAAYELLVTPTLQAFVTVDPTSGVEQETVFRISSSFISVDIDSETAMLSQLIGRTDEGNVIALSGINPLFVYNIKLSSELSEVGVRVFDSVSLQLAGIGFAAVDVTSFVTEAQTDGEQLDLLLSLLNSAVSEVIELIALGDLDGALSRIISVSQTFGSFGELFNNLEDLIPNEAEREQFVSEVSNALAFLSQSIFDIAGLISDNGQLGLTDLVLGAAEAVSQIAPAGPVFFRDDTVGFLIDVVVLISGGSDIPLDQVAVSLENAQSIQNLFSNLISALESDDARFSLSTEQVNSLVTAIQDVLAAAIANSPSEGQTATVVTSSNIRQTTLRVPKSILAQFQVLLRESSIPPVLVSGEGDVLLVLTEFLTPTLFDANLELSAIIQTLAAYDLEESGSDRRRRLMADTNDVQLDVVYRLETSAADFVDGTNVICQQTNEDNQFFNFAVAANIAVVGDLVFADCPGGSFGFYRIDIGILDQPFPPSPPPPPPLLPPGFTNPPGGASPPPGVSQSPPVIQPLPPDDGGGGGGDNTVLILIIVFSILGVIMLGVLIFYGAKKVQNKKFESMYRAAAQGESLDTQEFYGSGPDGQPTNFISMPMARSMRTRANVSDDSILAGFGNIVSGSRSGQNTEEFANPVVQSRDEPT